MKKLALAVLAALATTSAWAGSQTVVMSANGNSQPLYLHQVSFAPTGLMLYVTGSLTCAVQIAADPNAGEWVNHDILVSKTTSANSSLGYPVTAVRLVVTNFSTGHCTLGVMEVGP